MQIVLTTFNTHLQKKHVMYLPLKTFFCVSNARITFSLITWQLVMHCVSVKLIYTYIQKWYRQRQNRIIQEIHDESKHIQHGHTYLKSSFQSTVDFHTWRGSKSWSAARWTQSFALPASNTCRCHNNTCGWNSADRKKQLYVPYIY